MKLGKRNNRQNKCFNKFEYYGYIVLNRVRFLLRALWHGVRRQRYRFFTMKSLILAQDER